MTTGFCLQVCGGSGSPYDFFAVSVRCLCVQYSGQSIEMVFHNRAENAFAPPLGSLTTPGELRGTVEPSVLVTRVRFVAARAQCQFTLFNPKQRVNGYVLLMMDAKKNINFFPHFTFSCGSDVDYWRGGGQVFESERKALRLRNRYTKGSKVSDNLSYSAGYASKPETFWVSF